jgi:hypothetical protein
MSVNYTEWFVQLKNKRTRQPLTDDSGVYNVLTTSTPAEATIYSDDKGTSGSNPGTITDGIIRFFTAKSVTTVDVSFLTDDGQPGFIKALTPSQHYFDVDVDNRSGMMLVLPFTIAASAVSFYDTGFDLNALHVVKDIKVKVTTAGGTSNILNVGHSASVSGLFNAVLSATGFKQKEQFGGLACANPVAATVSLTVNGWFGVSMLYSATDNTNVKPYFLGAATSIVFKEANQTGATGAGYIYMILDKLVV